MENRPSGVIDDEKARLLALAVTDLAQFEGALAARCRACVEAVVSSDREAPSALAELDDWRALDRYAVTRVTPQDWRPIAQSVATVLDPIETIRPTLATFAWHQRHQPSVQEFLETDPEVARQEIEESVARGDLAALFQWSLDLREAPAYVLWRMEAQRQLMECADRLTKGTPKNDHDSAPASSRSETSPSDSAIHDGSAHAYLAVELLPAVLRRSKERIARVGIRESLRHFDRVRGYTRMPEDDFDGAWLGSFDDALGIAVVGREFDTSLVRTSGGLPQYTVYMGTPYSYIRDFYRHISGDRPQTIYDLGGGTGRVVLYGALTREKCRFVGVELVPAYANLAEAARQRCGAGNARIVNANVLDLDLSDGDTFFLFNPFSTEVLEKVIERLHAVARAKPIRIVAWGPCKDHFSWCDWLRQSDITGEDTQGSGGSRFGLSIFDSQAHG